MAGRQELETTGDESDMEAGFETRQGEKRKEVSEGESGGEGFTRVEGRNKMVRGQEVGGWVGLGGNYKVVFRFVKGHDIRKVGLVGLSRAVREKVGEVGVLRIQQDGSLMVILYMTMVNAVSAHSH